VGAQHRLDLEEVAARAEDGVAAMETDGSIVLWNAAASQLLGHAARAVIGRKCWEIFDGSGAGGERLCCEACPVMRTAASGEPVRRLEMASRTLAGRPLRLEISTLSGHGGQPPRLLVVHLFRAVPLGPEPSVGVGRRACASGPADRAPALTRRELEVLVLLRDGGSTRSIAGHLHVSRATVRNHAQSILEKLGAHSRLEAVAQATRRRLLPRPPGDHEPREA